MAESCWGGCSCKMSMFFKSTLCRANAQKRGGGGSGIKGAGGGGVQLKFDYIKVTLGWAQTPVTTRATATDMGGGGRGGGRYKVKI